jgi:prephenate dehydrogenase
MRIALLGLGLIGGSLARAVRRAGEDRLVAWTPSGSGPAAALAAGVIDEAAPTPTAAVRDADLVVLAAPPLECLELIDRLAGPWRAVLRPDATVTDVSSTKAAIVGRADAAGLPFVGGHPMAGRETSGFDASTEDLFAGRPWVVVPGAAARVADVERVERLATHAGGRPLRMSAGDHDAAVAAISHLPLLASAALVEAVGAWVDDGGSDPAILGRLAASGWRDATRLAAGDPTMGAGILATNAVAVADVLERLRGSLDAWAAELESPAGPGARRLEARLAAARARLAGMRRAGEP